jgi:UDP-3-O-[3-hydroxymyristoyl] glucosamine N-acyltransferase
MDKKYEVLKDRWDIADGDTLYRIRALRDFGTVKAGDLGGLVSGEHNLSQVGDCWIHDPAIACDNSVVKDDALLFDKSRLRGFAVVHGKAQIRGDAEISGVAMVGGSAVVSGCATIYGGAKISGSPHISGHIVIGDNTEICGSMTIVGQSRPASISQHM